MDEKILYMVSSMSGSYEDIYTQNLFLFNSKEEASLYIDKLNKLIDKVENRVSKCKIQYKEAYAEKIFRYLITLPENKDFIKVSYDAYDRRPSLNIEEIKLHNS